MMDPQQVRGLRYDLQYLGIRCIMMWRCCVGPFGTWTFYKIIKNRITEFRGAPDKDWKNKWQAFISESERGGACRPFRHLIPI